MMTDAKVSWSEIPYGRAEIKKDAASLYSNLGADSLEARVPCCIEGCGELLPRRHRGQRPHFCPKHGISMSTKPTYIYQDPERNFILGKEIPKRMSKVESWRLGFETSEDAVSWNVFVGLQALGGLPQAFNALTGMIAKGEPELYLWGNRIDTGLKLSPWAALYEVRATLEKGAAIPTEPDIALRVPGQAVVLIEAKFGSANSVLAKKRLRFGSVTEFLNRYRCKRAASDPLNRKWISEQEDTGILEQLCRNAIFADWLASEHETPFLINLVRRASKNDEQMFRQHLSVDEVQFHVRTWEDLCGLSVIQGEQSAVLRSYLRNKTLNLLPAFGDF